MVRVFVPGPVMVIEVLILSVLPSVIVPVRPFAKLMMSPFDVLAIASRSEQSESHTPSLVSANFVTTNVLGVGVIVGVLVVVNVIDGVNVTGTVDVLVLVAVGVALATA